MQTEIPASSRQVYPPAKGGYHRARRDLLSGGYHRGKVGITAPRVGITAETMWVSPRQRVGITAGKRVFRASAKSLNRRTFAIVHRACTRAHEGFKSF